MKTSIRYVEIENFKAFHEKLHIDLVHPAVLIGPNNAGKTSVIQALSLWSRGIASWYEKKGEPRKKQGRERISAGINRLNILDVPVAEARFLWSGTKVRKNNKPIEMTINVGIERNGVTHDCRLIFTCRDSEVIYCKPCPETVKDEELLKCAMQLQFHLLYPMSGIMSGISAESEETPLPDGRINVYLGQGQTAQVLRNICYKVTEQDEANQTQDWKKVTGLIERIFMVKLGKPIFNAARGSLTMSYQQDGVDSPLDIALAGRGLQQILLILAYLFWHKRSVLLVDEPDAHLEILRQRQIYEILKTVAYENGCQVIIATHSEVILDDAIDTNLTMLLNGTAVNLATHQDMKNALRTYGIEHYYKAKVHPRILYVEGSTDVEMLRKLAQKIGHERAITVLSDRINCFYTRDVNPDDSLDARLDRASGAFSNFKTHFNTLKRFVSELKGCALFDSDGRPRSDDVTNDLAICYWQRYELENYFITPETLLKHAQGRFSHEDGELFVAPLIEDFKTSLNACLLEDVFNGDENQLNEFNKASASLQATILKAVKMSKIAEKTFQTFAQKRNQPPLLTKGNFYQLIDCFPAENLSDEISKKLDLMADYLELS